jgi:SAM-dependent methyltransferase
VREVRDRIYRILEAHLRPGGSILDLGCGTGEDALHYARGGFAVTCVDPSPGMLEEAAKKLGAFSGRVRLLRTDARHLGMLAEGSFDGILSNFGALNCVEDPAPVLERSAELLTDGGVLALCLLNPYSLWETGSFLLRGEMASAFRRWKRGRVQVRVGQGTVATWYHRVGEILRETEGSFRTLAVIGLNVLTPPPGSMRFRERHPRLAGLLARVDERVAALPVFSRLGDHVLLLLERKPGVPRISHPAGTEEPARRWSPEHAPRQEEERR